MRLLINFIFYFFVSTLIAQSEYELKLKVNEKSDLAVVVDTISEKKFNLFLRDNPKLDFFTKNSDSLLKRVLFEYNNIIKIKDTCLVFKALESEEKLCKYIPEPFNKGFMNYEVMGQKKGFLVFEKTQYEWWEYFCFNPETQKSFYTKNYPIFISDKLVFSIGNYYLEGQFEILDLERNKKYSFDSFNWEIVRFYRVNKTFYLNFKNNHDNSESRYIKITLI